MILSLCGMLIRRRLSSDEAVFVGRFLDNIPD